MNERFKRTSYRPPITIPQYKSWREVAGYFDGDGCVGFSKGKYVVRFQLSWADNSFDQLSQLRDFLLSHRIEVGSVTSSEARRLEIGAQSAVLKSATELRRFSSKKHYKLSVACDYLRNRISGSEAVERLNYAIDEGSREGKVRHVDIPWTRREGKNLEHRIAVERLATKNRILTLDLIKKIISEYRSNAVTQAELSKRYGVGRSSVERVLKDKT